MELVTYRSFRPLDERTPKMNEFYRKAGITESFLRDVRFDGVHEIAWILAARKLIGRKFAEKLRRELGKDDPHMRIEERSKRLARIAEKLHRSNRMAGGLEAPDYLVRMLRRVGFEGELHSLGSIKDWYGIRLITPCGPQSRDRCYELLERVFEAARISTITQIAALVDYLSYNQSRFAVSGEYLGRYESLHVSFIHLGIPIEVQIRDSEMDWNAKNTVKRPGLD